MESSHRVVRNSFWMVAQPLALNVVSLFVVGYIARVLGHEDYGRFIFGFAFVGMFVPFANMGLQALTVRQVAKERSHAEAFINRMLTSRVVLALLSMAAAVIGISLTGYDAATKWVVYVASLSILTQAVATTLHDVFEAHERMDFVAYARGVSGAVLTALSVLVLVAGLRLFGLTAAYVAGGAVALLVTWPRFVKDFHRPRLVADAAGARADLVKAAPFFVPSLVAIAGSKIGIIILSSAAGVEAVGSYGAASSLVDRLALVPDGICTALFPAMALAYSREPDEAGKLFKQFFLYGLMLGLPLAVGTTVLARPIIVLVYGPSFADAAGVLQVLIWWLFATFLTSVQSWTLGAIHREKVDGAIKIVATGVSVAACFLLIPTYGARGAAAALLVAGAAAFLMLTVSVRRYLVADLANAGRVAKVVVASAVMGAVCFWMQGLNVVLAVCAGALVYAGVLAVTRCVTAEELRLVRGIVRRQASDDASPPVS